MAHNNRPVLTGEQLLDHVGLIAGGIDHTEPLLERAVKNVLTSFGDKLKNKFFTYLPVAGNSNVLDLKELGIEHVTNVWWSCGESGIYNQVWWFQVIDHKLQLDGWDAGGCSGGWAMIEHWQNPPWLDTNLTGTLSTQFVHNTPDGSEIHVTVTDASGIPPAGFVRVGDGADAQWYEYQATYYGADPQTDVILMLSKTQPWAHQIGTAFVGEAVVWGIGFPNSLLLDATTAQAAAYYWASKTGSCINEDDRSVATQMMNFWSGEAEDKWRLNSGERTARFVRNQVLSRGPDSWPFL